MAVLTLEQAKEDLAVDGTADDARVQSLLTAAIQSASEYINRAIPWKDDLGADVEVPEAVNAAIRLELRALFADPTSVHSPAFRSLLNPYRIY